MSYSLELAMSPFYQHNEFPDHGADSCDDPGVDSVKYAEDGESRERLRGGIHRVDAN